MNTLRLAILNTLNYAKKHQGKLTQDELCARLLGQKIFKRDEIKKSVLKNKIKLDKKNENKYFKKKFEKAKWLVETHLLKFKSVLMVGISGSVAAGYPGKNDDIDLIIIVREDFLWLTRLIWKIYSLLNKIPERKFKKSEREDEFCFNLWLDEKSLILPENKQNLTSAVDLILMKPILNKHNICEKFILTNSWAKKYVATGYDIKIKGQKSQIKNKKINNNHFLIIFFNWMAFIGQYLYMRRKMKTEKVGLHFAFFHRN